MYKQVFKFTLFFTAFFSLFIFTPLLSWAAGCPIGGPPGPCFSYNRGEELYCWVAVTIAGNIGTMVGLVIAFSGFVTWIWQKSVIGIVILLVGVSITAFPGLYQGFLGALGRVTAGQSSDQSRMIEYYAPNCGATGTLSVKYPPNCGNNEPWESCP